MRHPGVWTGVALAAVLCSSAAWGKATGMTAYSGKQNGATCKECHQAFTKYTYLDVAILNKVGLTPATQPLSPMQQYVFQVSVTYGMNATFGAGFNLAVGNATTPAKSGTLSVNATDTGVRILDNEATHTLQRPSGPIATVETVRWLVDYQPPAVGGPTPTTTFPIKLYAGVSRGPHDGVTVIVTAQDGRSLSAVSNGRNTGNAPECGPGTVVGFDPAACGVTFTVSTLPCSDVDGDTFLPATCYSDVTNGGGDCDDNNPNAHPGATEMCNGVDDNCDGATDEGFTFATAAVLMSTPSQDGGLASACDDSGDTDLCLHGSVVCKPDGTGTLCDGDVPTPEVCGNGVDDNCDGRVDETDALVWNGLHYNEPCHSIAVAGMCKNGVVRCINQRPGCFGDTPTVEICGNGMDDDCDGERDNGCPDAGIPVTSSSGPASSSLGTASSTAGMSGGSETGNTSTTVGDPPDPGTNSNCLCATTGQGMGPALLLLGLWVVRRPRTTRA